MRVCELENSLGRKSEGSRAVSSKIVVFSGEIAIFESGERPKFVGGHSLLATLLLLDEIVATYGTTGFVEQ